MGLEKMNITTLKNILRLKKILSTLIKYGFGGVVSELNIFPWFSFVGRVFARKSGKGLTTPERIRLVLEELGPTFIKLGQVASTRADILPPEWLEEFKKLQDDVPSFDFKEVKRVVEVSLKAPIKKNFASFEERPVASASIAQVHYATLHDGTEVAVKVRRPGIEKTINADISVMRTLATLLHKHVPASRRYRPTEVVAEFARVINNELNLTIEGSNATRFGRLFKSDPHVKIPQVYWDYTSDEVLTMERISGVPLDETEKIKSMGLDVKKIAINGLKAFFRQVFEFGIFHGDLHPGNIFTSSEGTIIYLDFGIVGRLDKDMRAYLAGILYSLIKQDYRRMAVIHRDMGLIGKDVDIHEFENALRDITEPIFGKSLVDINISTLLMKLIDTARRFEMTLQPNLLLLQKSMVIIEGVGRQLYPDINMWEVAKPLVTKWMIKEKFSPGNYVEGGREFVHDLGSTVLDLPGQLHTLLTTTLKDELKIGFIHHGIDGLSGEIAATGRSITGGLVLASVILSSTLIAVFAGESVPTFLSLPYPATLGFIISGLLGIRLWNTHRRERRRRELGI
ncbi:Ubiquinone biosynthesis regulatory protein kinase UbiB [hydrothermal vent metagenome]|uniref:Ubiquinone biosynthesis regulatory protein kinase UbiB n=1 Tax=hydrothermal vent metagenome TaxID=652676 RepID=A0A3B0VKV8_9ZZZZ